MEYEHHENVVIEKDYTAEAEYYDEIAGEYCDEITSEEEKKEILAFVERSIEQSKRPRAVVPEAAKLFDELVEGCDKIAKEFTGRMEAEVNYENHTASITLECLWIDFDGEYLKTLRRLTAAARSVDVMVQKSGTLRLMVYLPYFGKLL